MISYTELLSTTAVVIIPGIAAWISASVKIAKLEARSDAKDEHLDRIEKKLDRLIEK